LRVIKWSKASILVAFCIAVPVFAQDDTRGQQLTGNQEAAIRSAKRLVKVSIPEHLKSSTKVKLFGIKRHSHFSAKVVQLAVEELTDQTSFDDEMKTIDKLTKLNLTDPVHNADLARVIACLYSEIGQFDTAIELLEPIVSGNLLGPVQIKMISADISDYSFSLLTVPSAVKPDHSRIIELVEFSLRNGNFFPGDPKRGLFIRTAMNSYHALGDNENAVKYAENLLEGAKLNFEKKLALRVLVDAYENLGKFENTGHYKEEWAAVFPDEPYPEVVRASVPLKALLNTEKSTSDSTLNSVIRTENPKILVRIPPRMPRAATSAGISGWVDLEFEVSSVGSVVSPRVVSSSHGGDYGFEKEALKSVKKWKYVPSTPHESTLKVSERIEFNSK